MLAGRKPPRGPGGGRDSSRRLRGTALRAGPRPGSQRALAAPPRRPGQEALQAPSAWEETRAGPQEAASPPLRSQAARLGCGGRGSPQALPLRGWPPGRGGPGCGSGAGVRPDGAQAAAAASPAVPAVWARAWGPRTCSPGSWRGGGRVHPRAPGPFSRRRSPAAVRGRSFEA